MATTQYYVDYGTGNDYIGASFTDGAFTVADMTLTKAGAFVNASPDHWYYLTDNGSGRVTPGYYKVSSKTNDNAVVLATSPKSGANDPADVVCVQATGAIAKPFRSLQGAFDLITRNATDGDQINLKAGTTQVNVTTLTLDEYGTPTYTTPLVIRGYTGIANDSGIGVIDCGGVTMWASSYNYMILADLQIHTFGDNNGIVLGSCLLYHCEIHKGASSPTSKYLVKAYSVRGCYLHNLGTTGTALNSCSSTEYNYIDVESGASSAAITYGGTTSWSYNIIVLHQAGQVGLVCGENGRLVGNIVYNFAAGTQYGLTASDSAVSVITVVTDNILVGFSGVGGKGIAAGYSPGVIGHNAFYNCTARYSGTHWGIDLSANDVILAADPFVSAVTGDFSLTTAGKAALRGVGWPAAYLGAHANTDGHVTIGPIQYGEAASYPALAKVIDDTSYDLGTGTYHAPDVGEVTDNAVFGAASAVHGTYHRPETSEVVSTAVFGISSGQNGLAVVPGAADVRFGTNVNQTTGLAHIPAAADVQFGVAVEATTGTFVVPAVADVKDGVFYGAASEFEGELVAGGGAVSISPFRGNIG
jgi:hypothetical protein